MSVREVDCHEGDGPRSASVHAVANCGPGRSDPWKKGARKRRPRHALWSEDFWAALCKKARKHGQTSGVPEACVVMIREINRELYGH